MQSSTENSAGTGSFLEKLRKEMGRPITRRELTITFSCANLFAMTIFVLAVVHFVGDITTYTFVALATSSLLIFVTITVLVAGKNAFFRRGCRLCT